MSATVFYDNINEIALISVTFLNSSQVPSDPNTVACVITDPGNVSVTHTYAGALPADIVKVSTGKYTLSVACSPAVAGSDGLWGYEWIGTGSVSDVQPGTWRVLPQAISQLWYIGLEEFKDRLAITDTADDTQAQIAIQSASFYVNEFCGRHFNQITETRTYRPDNIWLLNVDDMVPGAPCTIAADTTGNGIFDQTMIPGVDVQLRFGGDLYNKNVLGIARPYRQIQVIQTGKWWPFTWPFTHLDRVQINTTWGWPMVPPQVTQASFILAADIFKSKDAPFGIAGLSDFGALRVQANPLLTKLLERFINPRHKVGV